jgi:protein TonB
LKYPTIAAENGIQGRVTLRFVVSKTGEITDVNIIKGLDPSCDKEAVRVVKTMPKWIPGKQNGRNVPVYYTLPVVFRLQ